MTTQTFCTRLRRAVALGALAFAAQLSHAQSTRVISSSGDLTPGNNEVFNFYQAPALNNLGEVAFVASVGDVSAGTGGFGLYRLGANRSARIARNGLAAPDGNGVFGELRSPALSDAGLVAFGTTFGATLGGSTDNSGLARGDGTAPPVLIARTGQLAPDGNGRFSRFDTAASLNGAGRSAFRASLAGTAGSSNDDRGFFAGNGGPLVQMGRAGQPAPGSGRFESFIGTARLNESGQAVFYGTVIGTDSGFPSQGIFRADGVVGGVPTDVVRPGAPGPGGVGTMTSFAATPLHNDVGQTAIYGTVSSPSPSGARIIRDEGNGTRTEIVRVGAAAPGAGTFFNVSAMAINNAGQVAIDANLSGTGGGTSGSNVRNVYYRGDGQSLVEIIRVGQAAPDGNGRFLTLQNFAMNEHGQAAFSASFVDSVNPSDDGQGLYAFDDALGLLTVAREGDPLMGSRIDSISFAAGANGIGEAGSGINDLGQIAYAFDLVNGVSGVAIFQIPEPTSMGLLAVGGGLLLRRRTRRRTT